MLNKIKNIIECFLFVEDKPLSIEKIAQTLEVEKELVRKNLEKLQDEYEQRDTGLKIVNIANGYMLVTREEYANEIKKLKSSDSKIRLSQAALEVLSIIAYKQPITKNEIEQIRGVESSSAIKTNLKRKLIRISGRKKVPGRPLIFSTSNNFLKYFGLTDLSELPEIEELEGKYE